jgi:hypothetical protein
MSHDESSKEWMLKQQLDYMAFIKMHAKSKDRPTKFILPENLDIDKLLITYPLSFLECQGIIAAALGQGSVHTASNQFNPIQYQ